MGSKSAARENRTYPSRPRMFFHCPPQYAYLSAQSRMGPYTTGPRRACLCHDHSSPLKKGWYRYFPGSPGTNMPYMMIRIPLPRTTPHSLSPSFSQNIHLNFFWMVRMLNGYRSVRVLCTKVSVHFRRVPQQPGIIADFRF
jgi:hypothetical protein